MKLIPELFEKNVFTLLTAPVAKGKTFSVINYYENHICRMVFVSPLRALANEVYEKLSVQKNVYLLGGGGNVKGSRDEIMLNFIRKKKALLITTVELLNDEFLNLIEEDSTPTMFVLDEFHLFYSWGRDFRPILHDTFLGILNTQMPVLALTATMSEEFKNLLIHDLSYDRDFWLHLDFGNQELYRKPSKISYFGGLDKLTIERAFTRELKMKKKDQVFLMFCSYRSEVDDKVEWAKRHGFKALGCVGGEVELFQEELKKHALIDCIFATTSLSHGVNLPEIKKVFINYEVKDYSFWLQMVGRGGRHGSSYEVYSFDHFHTEKMGRLKDFFKIQISDWIGFEV